jgi:hypothetical protein
MCTTVSCVVRTAPSPRATYGRGHRRGQGTIAQNINPAGTIASFYLDANNVAHGYVRAPDGTITTYDAPGAGTGSGQGTSTSVIDCINPMGAIEGESVDANNVMHGYVRAPDGAITTFDAPGTGTGSFQGTFPMGISPAGAALGLYLDTSNVNHGFVRSEDGAITTFEAPGAGAGSGQGTLGLSINPAGVVAGVYIDANSVTHGFLRHPDGAFTTIDVPDAAKALARAPTPLPTTQGTRLRDTTLTRVACITASCGSRKRRSLAVPVRVSDGFNFFRAYHAR